MESYMEVCKSKTALCIISECSITDAMCWLHNIRSFILIWEQQNQYPAIPSIIINTKCCALLRKSSLKINWLQPYKRFTVLLSCFLAPYCGSYKTLAWSGYFFFFFCSSNQGNLRWKQQRDRRRASWGRILKKKNSAIHNSVPEITFLSQIRSSSRTRRGPETSSMEAVRGLGLIPFNVSSLRVIKQWKLQKKWQPLRAKQVPF